MRSKLCILLLVISTLTNITLGNSSQAEKASQRWHQWRKAQEKYPLAAWSYFYRFEGTEEEYQIYADAGLTLVTVPDDHYDNATKAGLDILLCAWKKPYEDQERLNYLFSFPNKSDKRVVGFQMIDEPRPDSFAGLSENMETIYNNDKLILPIIDLLPNWAWQRNSRRVERFGMNYDAFLRRFINEVHPPVLLNCHYPTLKDGTDRPEYYPNIETFRDHALKNDIGLMGLVLNNPHFSYRKQSESDIYWQVYSHLAYGAQGIWYYNWRINPVNGFGEGMVTYAENKPTNEYWMVKKINSEIAAIGKILMKLKSINVFHTGETVPPGTTRFPNLKDSGSCSVEYFDRDNFIIGEFINQDDPEDKSAYVMFVNKKHGEGLSSNDSSLTVSAIFKPSVNFAYAYYYDKSNGELKALPVVMHNGENGYRNIKLGGGNGVLVRLSKKPLLGESVSDHTYGKTTAVFARSRARKDLEVDAVVVVDGVLDDPVWQSTPVYKPLLAGEKNSVEPKESADFQVGWHDKHLYIAAEFEDTDILAYGEKNDDPHYKLGDVFEVFIKPQFSDWYWEIWLTPHGKHTSVYWPKWKELATGQEQYYKLNMDYAAKIDGSLNDSNDTDNGWSCELDIPFDEFTRSGKLNPQGKWLILLARQNYNGQVDIEHRELSSFPRLSKKDFHTHQEYNLLDMVIRAK